MLAVCHNRGHHRAGDLGPMLRALSGCQEVAREAKLIKKGFEAAPTSVWDPAAWLI